MEKINKKDIIDALSEEKYISKKESREVIEYLLDLIAETLSEGKEVNITGFGSFSPRYKKARECVDPNTHEKISVGESVTVKFKPSKELKEKLNK